MQGTVFRKFACIFLLAFASNAQPEIIVDTGPGSGLMGFGWVLRHDAWLAAEFTTSQTHVVTDVFGHMGATVEGTGTVAIYSDGGAARRFARH